MFRRLPDHPEAAHVAIRLDGFQPCADLIEASQTGRHQLRRHTRFAGAHLGQRILRRMQRTAHGFELNNARRALERVKRTEGAVQTLFVVRLLLQFELIQIPQPFECPDTEQRLSLPALVP